MHLSDCLRYCIKKSRMCCCNIGAESVVVAKYLFCESDLRVHRVCHPYPVIVRCSCLIYELPRTQSFCRGTRLGPERCGDRSLARPNDGFTYLLDMCQRPATCHIPTCGRGRTSPWSLPSSPGVQAIPGHGDQDRGRTCPARSLRQ